MARKDIKNRWDLMTLRDDYKRSYANMYSGLRLQWELALTIAAWRVFSRRQWILYMLQVVGGKIPSVAVTDVMKMKGEKLDQALKAWDWE